MSGGEGSEYLIVGPWNTLVVERRRCAPSSPLTRSLDRTVVVEGHVDSVVAVADELAHTRAYWWGSPCNSPLTMW